MNTNDIIRTLDITLTLIRIAETIVKKIDLSINIAPWVPGSVAVSVAVATPSTMLVTLDVNADWGCEILTKPVVPLVPNVPLVYVLAWAAVISVTSMLAAVNGLPH